MKRCAYALIACLMLVSSAEAAERRLALVIGNSAYRSAPLVNPGNDARAMAEILRDSGFTVIERRNVNQGAMRQVIREFGDELVKGGIGLFFYAGHGMQIRGKNYLIPVGSDIRREDEVEDQAVDASLVLQKMATAKNTANIVILDACRNNPFASSFRSAAAGLAVMDAPAGTLVAFSTAPGQVAADGTGDNGLYTKHLVSYMREPGLKVEDVFKRVRAAVRQESRGSQTPWENTSLEVDIYFKAPDPKALAEDQEERRREQQTAIERAVKEALARQAQQAGADRAKVEQEIAQRVAAERAAVERKAQELVAVTERAVEAAIQGMARGGAPSVTREQPARPVIAPPAAPGVGAAPVPALPKVGDAWAYKVTDRNYETAAERMVPQIVEAVTDTEIHMKMGKGAVRFNHDWNMLYVVPRDGIPRKFEPFQPQFSFPMEPGKTWHGKYTATLRDRVVEFDRSVAVIGWEDVTVPAGTFKALKVSSVDLYRRTDPGGKQRGRVVSDVWFAPQVKRFVKSTVVQVGNNKVIQRDETWELVKFRLQ